MTVDVETAEISINFAKPGVRRVVSQQRPVRVRETVTVTPVRRSAAPQHTAYKGKPPTSWDWRDLQAYVVEKITEIHGAQPRDTNKELGIFTSFAGRHGADAGPIAVFAFETQTQPGYWMGAPISVSRFCKGSDKYFAERIKQRLV